MQRPDPLYAGTRQATLGNGDGRGGPVGGSNGRINDNAESNQSRAARFEDEKRRIIESCFSKRDPDGSQVESYITHVRIIEDAMHPSSPPPPDSIPSNKKIRIILVAVRKSGKVRVHKARENPAGSFSIGKTWPLEDLNSIKSYSALIPASIHEQMEKQWASNLGFIITLVKPYYWQAPTSKEKDFFLASLIKIYRKYTGGKLPELIGFDPRDIEQLTGASPNPNTFSSTGRSPSVNQSAVTSPNIAPSPAFNSQQPPYSARNPNREVRRTDSQEWEQTYGRNDQRPSTRDAPPKQSQDSGRSPLRTDLRSSGRDEQKGPGLPERPTPQDRVPSGGTRIPETPQQTPQKPSLSPKSSQSSFTHSVDKRSDASSIRPNGIPLGSPAPINSGRRNLTAAKSQESMRSGSEAAGGSRPSTATTDRRTPEPTTNGPRSHEASFSSQLRPPVPKIDGLGGQRFGKSEATSSPSTSGPVDAVSNDRSRMEHPETQSALKELPQKKSLDYFANKAGGQTGALDLRQPPALTEPEMTASPKSSPSAKVASETTPEPTEHPEEMSPKAEDEYRPGLGPMIKKKSGKDIANQFRKAALAATAFQPRQGGAGARLKAMHEKSSNEPDGITGVVPAPLSRGASADSAVSTLNGPKSPFSEKDRPGTPASTGSFSLPKLNLQRKATEDNMKSSQETPAAEEPPKQEQRPSSPDKARSRSPQRKRRQKQEAEIEKYCSSLGIDPRVLEARGADFNELLTEFGWEGKLPENQKLESFAADIRREIGRAQATGWLGHVEQQENKVQDLAKAFDRAIAECEELDGLLTLYSHELDTLHDDIEHIEAQSQGLQVQTANQKLLRDELQTLLKTLTISTSDLQSLRMAPIDAFDGLRAIEGSLVLLYRAMLTIDPELRENELRQQAATSTDRTGVSVYADVKVGQMQAVTQKKNEYRDEALHFIRRFNQHMKSRFELAEQRTSEENTSSAYSGPNLATNLKGYQILRNDLWKYSAMMLFVREVQSHEWRTLVNSYGINMKSSYQEHFRDYVMAKKKTVRPVTTDELEVLFTHQEKDKNEDSLTSSAARKLTVKRGKTVKASALRQSLGERRDGKLDAWEIFDNVLQQQAQIVFEEQNFIVHLFHLNSQSHLDFAELVATQSPQHRRFPDLSVKLSYDPDREMATTVQKAINEIYSFWALDMQALTEWVFSIDRLQGVGVLHAIEQCLASYEETNQEYLVRALRMLHDRLTGLFHKFVDDQVKAIEETKVKIKKRKGVISFMRTFPLFSTAVESMMSQGSSRIESLELRFIVNDAYTKILKAMWESLNFIANDNPASRGVGVQSAAPSSGGDPEDKEALNYNILLIENMNHYVEEVDSQHNAILDEWAERASHDLSRHLAQYTDAVIRRPLGKWLDFLESTEAMMKNTDSYATIAGRPSHSRSAAKKVLASYDSKEVRKGVETLKKRIEKHFGDVDDPSNFSRSLISRVFDECTTMYTRAFDRMKLAIDQLYEGNLEIEWRKEDVAALFKR